MCVFIYLEPKPTRQHMYVHEEEAILQFCEISWSPNNNLVLLFSSISHLPFVRIMYYNS